jgi:hypothetical protein
VPDTTFPTRPPAAGPAVVLDLPALWRDVEERMRAMGILENPRTGRPEIKALCDLTGLDRNTVGRIRKVADNNTHTQGQRGGINVNAYLTLLAFAGGTAMNPKGAASIILPDAAPYGRFADRLANQ